MVYIVILLLLLPTLRWHAPCAVGIKETAEDRERDKARAEFADKYDMGGDMKVSQCTDSLQCSVVAVVVGPLKRVCGWAGWATVAYL